MLLWKLCQQQHARELLEGEGAKLYGGRWNYPGTAVVYAADSLALAALEMLVHIDVDLLPGNLVAVSIAVPGGILIEKISAASLPDNWRSTPAPEYLQRLGETWIERATSALLRVPSAVIPEEHNYLFNPAHPDCRRLRLGRAKPFIFDRRLLRRATKRQ